MNEERASKRRIKQKDVTISTLSKNFRRKEKKALCVDFPIKSSGAVG